MINIINYECFCGFNWELIISILSLILSIAISIITYRLEKTAQNFSLNEKKERYIEEINEYFNNLETITYLINNLITKVINIFEEKNSNPLSEEVFLNLKEEYKEYYNEYFINDFKAINENIIKLNNKSSVKIFLKKDIFLSGYKENYFCEFAIAKQKIKYLMSDINVEYKEEHLNEYFQELKKIRSRLNNLDKDLNTNYKFEEKLKFFIDSIKN